MAECELRIPTTCFALDEIYEHMVEYLRDGGACNRKLQ